MNAPMQKIRIASGLHQGAEICMTPGQKSIGPSEACDFILSDTDLPDLSELTLKDDGSLWLRSGEEAARQLNPGQRVSLGSVHLMLVDPEHQDFGDVPAPPREESVPPVPGKSFRIAWAGIGLVALILAIGLLLPVDPSQEPTPHVLPDLPDLPAGVTSQMNGGMTTVTGYLSTEADVRNLQAMLRATGRPVKFRVQAMEPLLQAAAMILESHDAGPIRVSPGGTPGALQLTGHSGDPVTRERILRTLREDLPAVARWEDKITTNADRAGALRLMLEASGLGDRIAVAQTDRGLQVKGHLRQQDQQAWQKVTARYRKKFGADAPLHSSAGLIHSFRPRAISLGRDPWILTESGDRITTGAELPEGGVVHRIMADRVILRQGDNLTPYYLEKPATAEKPGRKP